MNGAIRFLTNYLKYRKLANPIHSEMFYENYKIYTISLLINDCGTVMISIKIASTIEERPFIYDSTFVVDPLREITGDISKVVNDRNIISNFGPSTAYPLSDSLKRFVSNLCKHIKVYSIIYFDSKTPDAEEVGECLGYAVDIADLKYEFSMAKKHIEIDNINLEGSIKLVDEDISELGKCTITVSEFVDLINNAKNIVPPMPAR